MIIKNPLILSRGFVSLYRLNDKDMNKDNEIFLPIKDYEGFYEVSNHGRIKSLERIDCMGQHRKERFLKLANDKNGYKILNLSKNRVDTNFRAHRLVAQHFIPNPDNLPQINHIDGNKVNNHVSNLEWCDNSYNLAHAIEMGLHDAKGIKNYGCVLIESQVLEIYNSPLKSKELSKIYPVGVLAISRIKSGYTWSHITRHTYVRKR